MEVISNGNINEMFSDNSDLTLFVVLGDQPILYSKIDEAAGLGVWSFTVQKIEEFEFPRHTENLEDSIASIIPLAKRHGFEKIVVIDKM